jgi:hypothetical protein
MSNVRWISDAGIIRTAVVLKSAATDNLTIPRNLGLLNAIMIYFDPGVAIEGAS